MPIPTRRLGRFSCLIALAIVAMSTVGCAGRVVRARRLPAQWQAANVSNARIVDLGRLSTPTPSSTVIEPEDVVDVSINSGIDPTAQAAAVPVRVGPDGKASIALIGDVEVAGLEPHAAEQEISKAAVDRGIYRVPQVTVTIRKKATNRITVIGAVEKPGVIEVPRGQSTLLTALVSAGALSKNAGTKVEVRRNSAEAIARRNAASGGVRLAAAEQDGEEVGNAAPQAVPVPAETITIDLAKLDDSGSQNLDLADGDVVRVEARDPLPINVIGLVRKPGQYEVPVNKPLHVLDALALAGERSNPWADKAIIKRHVRGQSEPIVIQTSISMAKRDNASNVRLAPGDAVSIEETPQTVTYNVLSSIFRLNVMAGGSIPLF
jgi:polysaccharide export outer membrane protein